MPNPPTQPERNRQLPLPPETLARLSLASLLYYILAGPGSRSAATA